MISVIIPTYTNVGRLCTCLQSLFTHEPDPGLNEVIVVFDGGPPKALKILKILADKMPIKLVLKAERGGFSSAINAGVQAANPDSEFYLLVNDDIEFVRPVFAPVLSAFEEDPKIAVVGAKLWYENGKLQHCGVHWVAGFGPCHWRHTSQDFPQSNRGEDCLVTGALFATRSKVFREIGGLDTEYKMGYEDTEYAMQALKRGYRVVYRPTVMAIHAEGATRTKDTLDPGNLGFQRFKSRWSQYWDQNSILPKVN